MNDTEADPCARAYAYVRSLRNRQKRAYALAYVRYRLGPPMNGPSAEPERGSLSFMAAQSVRMAVSEILKNTSTKGDE